MPKRHLQWFLLTTEIIEIIFVIWQICQGKLGLIPAIIWLLSILNLIILYFVLFNPILKFPQFSKKTLIVFCIILFSFFARLYWLRFPQYVYFHGDEAILSRNAETNYEKGIRDGNWNILGSEEGTLNRFPALWYLLDGTIIYTLGPNLISVKLLSLVTDVFLALVIFLLTRKVFNELSAFLSVFLYLSLPIIIHFSVTGYQNLQSTFFLFLGLLIVYDTSQNKKNLYFHSIISGITIGISFYFYLSSLVNPIFILISIFALYKELRTKIIATILFICGLVITLVPYIVYSLTSYNLSLGRSSVIVLQNSSLSFWMNQIGRFLSGFPPFGGMFGSGLHYPSLPLFPNWPLFFCFLIGLLSLFLNPKRPNSIILLSILIITSLTGGIFTEAPPAAQRLIHLYPLVIIISVIGINVTSNKLSYILGFSPTLFKSLLTIFCLFANLNNFFRQNIPTYFRDRPQDVLETITLLKNNHDLLVDLPAHKIDHLYYYSNGKIHPQGFTCSRPTQSIVFLTNLQGLKILQECFEVNYQLIKSWTQSFEDTFLLQLSPGS